MTTIRTIESSTAGPACMNRNIEIEITDWPSFHRTTTVSLSPDRFDSDEAMREYLAKRYGSGRLTEPASGHFHYERDVKGFAVLGKLLFRVLNHGYS